MVIITPTEIRERVNLAESDINDIKVLAIILHNLKKLDLCLHLTLEKT